MIRVMLRFLFLLLLLLPRLSWTADTSAPEAELQQVEAELQRVQREQQTVFQQFQMTQELRRNEMDAANPKVIQNSPVYAQDNPPPNYEDVVRERQQRDERIAYYTDELNRLYARYQDLERQKAALLERESQLRQGR
ncbi:MAG: hypothetical protein C5B46_05625 [Proteobacteria bacterium]|nr:MAG: hypothetical protein C5B46_05625 [Pseudomonadota bacterium]